ncbi:hypothetical protein [Staphylococcus aureus]|nr:hypothetical protein [Staphylococcus aureus]
MKNVSIYKTTQELSFVSSLDFYLRFYNVLVFILT